MLKTLFLLNLKSLLTSTFARGNKQSGTGKKILITLLFSYAIIALMFAFGAMFYTFAKPFFGGGIGWMYWAIYACLSFALCVITTIFAANSQIFEAKDNETLLALPIKPSYILISRILVLYVYELFFSVLIALPALAIWLYFGYATALGTILFLVSFFLLPLFSLSIALLLAWLLSILTARMKNKNIFTLLLSIAFLVLYFKVYSNIQGYLGKLVTHGQELATAFQKSMPPFYYFGSALANANLLHFLFFTLWMLIPFTLCIYLLSINFNRLLIRQSSSTKRTNLHSNKLSIINYQLSISSPLWAFTKKELSYFWSKPMVVLNTSMGSLFAIIGSIYILFNMGTIEGQIAPLLAGIDGIRLPWLLASALTAVVLMNNLSSSLISLEGKYLWLAKSAPVSEKIILKSKLLAHILTTSIPCFLASIILSLFAQNIGGWLLIFILPQVAILTTALLGLCLNLQMPKLDWINEVIIVKQSMPAMITVFGAMALVASLTLLHIYVLHVSLPTFLILCCIAFSLISALAYNWLITQGTEKFKQLN